MTEDKRFTAAARVRLPAGEGPSPLLDLGRRDVRRVKFPPSSVDAANTLQPAPAEAAWRESRRVEWATTRRLGVI
jgi:hypothetical protein